MKGKITENKKPLNQNNDEKTIFKNKIGKSHITPCVINNTKKYQSK